MQMHCAYSPRPAIIRQVSLNGLSVDSESIHYPATGVKALWGAAEHLRFDQKRPGTVSYPAVALKSGVCYGLASV
jgi:hypothetical protein